MSQLDPFELLSAAASRAGVSIVEDTEEQTEAASGGWLLPAEYDFHERSWLAWPTDGQLLGRTEGMADEGRAAWAAVANALSEFEPVSVVCRPGDEQKARRLLAGDITIHLSAHTTPWLRETGPSFVLNAEGILGSVDWATQHDSPGDAQLASRIGEWAQATRIPSSLRVSPSELSSNGRGSLLVLRTQQLAGSSGSGGRRAVEEQLGAVTGTSHTVWLPHTLTSGAPVGLNARAKRIDDLAVFAGSNVILAHDQRDGQHPDSVVSKQLRQTLSTARNSDGNPFELVWLPAPETLRDTNRFVSYSYVNHYVTNDAVLMGTYRDPNDDVAAAILADRYGREVVRVDARPLFARGGGVRSLAVPQPRSQPHQQQ